MQFCRYATRASALGARVILQVQPPLVDLLSTLDGVRVMAESDELPPFDRYCPLLSLPLAFGTDLQSIPATARYLSGRPDRVAHWRAALDSCRRPRIGLVWRGDPHNRDDRQRSLPLEALLRHLPPEGHYVSLQKEILPSERAAMAAFPAPFALADELNFIDTAAVCECLDLVLSVDTSVAHVSAALGRPTWLLLPFSPDCRWLLGREDSPWYPTARLFRQPFRGDWDGMLRQVTAALGDLAGRCEA